MSFFHDDGIWLRCQLHAHTTNSDGDATPEALCDHYAEAGFDVLAITDHWAVTTLEHDRLVLVPARCSRGMGSPPCTGTTCSRPDG